MRKRFAAAAVVAVLSELDAIFMSIDDHTEGFFLVEKMFIH